MAREWYLRGVDPEELKYRPQAPEPQTPRGWLENFWYHHKWKVILGGAFLAIGVFLLVHTLSRTDPDYLICLVSMQEVDSNAAERLETILEQYGEDLNGDGKVVVEIQCLNVSSGTESAANPSAVTNQQAVLGHMMAKDVDLWAFAPEYYTTSIRSALGDESRFFLPLTTMQEVSGVSEDGVYWNWEGLSLLESDTELITVPDVLYWGVANWENATAEDQARAADMMQLLERFAKAQTGDGKK